MATASGRTSGHSDASVAGEQSPVRQRQRREPGKPTWRCLNRLSLSSAWLAPLNRGNLNSAHIHGTDVPVEEPSTASEAEVARRTDGLCLPDHLDPGGPDMGDAAASYFGVVTGKHLPARCKSCRDGS